MLRALLSVMHVIAKTETPNNTAFMGCDSAKTTQSVAQRGLAPFYLFCLFALFLWLCRFRHRFSRFVIANDPFQWANFERRTLFAAGDNCDGAYGHFISPVLIIAELR